MFPSRDRAASMLADRLMVHRGERPLVLGLTRGGVVVARIVADTIQGDLDVFLVRHLRATSSSGPAVGAIDQTGSIVKGPEFCRLSDAEVQKAVRTHSAILKADRVAFAHGHLPIALRDRVVILVDDGVETGMAMLAGIRAARAAGARRVVVAVPTAPRRALAAIRMEADDVVCLRVSDDRSPVASHYDEFRPVSDDEVVTALRRHKVPFAA